LADAGTIRPITPICFEAVSFEVEAFGLCFLEESLFFFVFSSSALPLGQELELSLASLPPSL